MKDIILIFFCITIAMEVSGNRRMRVYMNQCVSEYELSKERFKEMQKSEDPRVGCIMACVMTKEGTMVDGMIDEEKLKKLKRVRKNMEKEIVSELVELCVDEAENLIDVCAKALAVESCVHVPLNMNEWRIQKEMQKNID